MLRQGRATIYLSVLLVSPAHSERVQSPRLSEAEKALVDLRSPDRERQRDAVRRLSGQPDEILALLADEIPKVAEESKKDLPRFLNAFTQTFAIASDKARVEALEQIFVPTYDKDRRREYAGEGLERWLEGPEASGAGRLLVLRLDCSAGETSPRIIRTAYVRWAVEVIRDPGFKPGQKVAAAHLLSCFGRDGIEALRATQPESTQLLIEVLRARADDIYPPAVAKILTDLDSEGTLRHLVAEVRGLDLVKRAEALTMLKVLYSTVKAPEDLANLIPEVLQGIQSPCNSTFLPSVRLLGVLGVKAAVPALLGSLRMTCAESARPAVLWALSNIRDPAATAPLIELLNDPSAAEAFRTAVAQTLSHIPDEAAHKASERFLNSWWRQRRTRVWAVTTLVLASGPVASLIQKGSLIGGLRAAYCSLAFLAGGWIYARIINGDSTLVPPFWPFLATSLFSWFAFIGGKDSPARRVRTPNEMATTRGALASAVITFAWGWASLLAGVFGLLLFMIMGLVGLRSHSGP